MGRGGGRVIAVIAEIADTADIGKAKTGFNHKGHTEGHIRMGSPHAKIPPCGGKSA
jgi:hypothetical protein